MEHGANGRAVHEENRLSNREQGTLPAQFFRPETNNCYVRNVLSSSPGHEVRAATPNKAAALLK